MAENTQIIAEFARSVIRQVETVVVGKKNALQWILAVILARGHILLEDIPGVGKTTMAVALSRVLDLGYSRVQFTPDVLPSDITGFSVPDPATGKLEYKPGAVLCNLFLADELNRATSRTQSALLEAMEEGQVTVDGIAHKLPQPFIVIATQNPTGAAGTQLLPDSQMDRFALCMTLGYPTATEECAMVHQRQQGDPMAKLKPILTSGALAQLQAEVEKTYISDAVVEYVVNLVGATRRHPQLLRGASPRATLCVIAVAKAVAQIQGRDYVTVKDAQKVFLKVIPHRLLLKSQAENSGVTGGDVLQQILEQVKTPALR